MSLLQLVTHLIGLTARLIDTNKKYGIIIAHSSALNDIAFLLTGNRDDINWSCIGFQTSDPASEFQNIGVLGLATIHYFIKKNVI